MAKPGSRAAGWIVFALLLAGCAVAWWWTAAAVSTSGFPANDQHHVQLPEDERPLVIASAMSGLADTPEEEQLAQRTQEVASRLVQAALRRQLMASKSATERHRGPEWTRFYTAKAAVARDQNAGRTIAARIAHAGSTPSPQLQAEEELTGAQLQLDQARLDDARQDLRRSHAPAMTTPQQVLASTQSAEAQARQLANKWRQKWRQQGQARNPETAHGLAVLVASWRLLATKVKALRWAAAQSGEAAIAARQAHIALHAQLQRAERQNGQRVAGALAQLQTHPARRRSKTSAPQPAAAPDTQALVLDAEQLAAGQRQLIGYDQTIHWQSALARAYQRWAEIGAAQQELAIHDAFGLALEILAGFAVLLLLDLVMARAARRWRGERRRAHTVRYLTRFVLCVAALLWLLLMALGKPAQWLTFLGLAGAGLTVALEDTILSFAGWFVVIGRRGVTPGDWVEINGVNGEVVEVTLLRTVLQEAGNWNEPGHATGRRVYLPNSFVFTGPYFNFSTRGQWLWDEIRVTPPSGRPWTPEAMSQIAALVEAETRADAAIAKREWEQVHEGRRREGGAATAGMAAAKLEFAPVVQLKPNTALAAGDLCVRYITTAALRAQRREHLYERIYALRAAAAG